MLDLPDSPDRPLTWALVAVFWIVVALAAMPFACAYEGYRGAWKDLRTRRSA